MSNLQAPRSSASIFYLTLIAMYPVGNIYASKIFTNYASLCSVQRTAKVRITKFARKINVCISCDGI